MPDACVLSRDDMGMHLERFWPPAVIFPVQVVLVYHNRRVPTIELLKKRLTSSTPKLVDKFFDFLDRYSCKPFCDSEYATDRSRVKFK